MQLRQHPLLLILLFGLFFRLTILLIPFKNLLFLITDDAFVQYNIARGLAFGLGPVADGVNLTNGFQPLPVLLHVPIFSLFPDLLVAPIYLSLLLLLFFNLAVTVPLYLLSRMLFGKRVALLNAFLWTFFSWSVFTWLNGLETSLSVFFIAWAAYFYLRLKRSEGKNNQVFLALSLGLGLLTRADVLFLVLAVFLDALISRLYFKNKFVVGRTVPSLIAALAIYSPWPLLSTLFLGSPVSDALVTLPLLSKFFNLYLNGLPITPGSIGFTLFLLYMALFHFLLQSTLFFTVLFPFNALTLQFLPSLWIPVSAIFTAIVFLVMFQSVRVLFKYGKNQLLSVSFLFLFTLFLFLFYVFYIGVYWYLNRYLFPASFIASIFFGKVVVDFSDRLEGKLRISSTKFLAVFTLFFLTLSFANIYAKSTYENIMYNGVDNCISVIPEGKRIGSFQTGYIRYFYPQRKFLNLDGFVNRNAADAIGEKRLLQYVLENDLEFLIDQPATLHFTLLNASTQDYRDYFYEVKNCQYVSVIHLKVRVPNELEG